MATVEINSISRSMYIRLTDAPIVISKEVAADVILDFSKDGAIVGIDIQHLTVPGMSIL